MCRDIAGPGDLEIVIDSEINQKEKDKDRIVSLTCAKTIKMKNNKDELTSKAETESQIQKTKLPKGLPKGRKQGEGQTRSMGLIH